jgi:hypothetical protein
MAALDAVLGSAGIFPGKTKMQGRAGLVEGFLNLTPPLSVLFPHGACRWFRTPCQDMMEG